MTSYMHVYNTNDTELNMHIIIHNISHIVLTKHEASMTGGFLVGRRKTMPLMYIKIVPIIKR